MKLKEAPLLEIFIVAAVYAFTAQIGLALAIPPGIATAVWPPSGVVLAIIILRGPRLLPGVWLGSFLANFPIVFNPAGFVPGMISLSVITAIAAGSTLQAYTGAFLVRKWVTPAASDIFSGVGNVFKFAVLQTLNCVVAATLGTAAIFFGGYIPADIIQSTWVTWWLGDLVGMFVLTPLLLTFANFSKKPLMKVSAAVEFILFFAIMTAHSVIVFWSIFPYTYSLFPFMVWGAFRFRALGASLAGIIVSFLAIWAAVRGFGPFALLNNSPEKILYLTQAFVGTFSLTAVALAAAVEDRKRAHTDLKKWERIFNAAGWAVCITEGGKLTSINAAFAKMHGYGIEELIGTPAIELTAPESRLGAQEHVGIADECGDHIFENLHLRKDGSVFPALVHLSVFKDEEGKVLFRASTLQDISDLKNAEENLKKLAAELDRSNKELEQFAYVASHDLQEPLRIISMYLELYIRRYKGEAGKEADEFIEYARIGAEDSQKLVRSLLEYAKIEAKEKSYRETDFDKVLKQSLSYLELSISESGAEITRGPLPKIVADPFQIGRLMQNLLSNAIKYRSPERPLKIHISAKKTGAEWMFAVTDNGIGIPAQHHERIFGIFQRLQSKSQGSGIGLAVCKKIVERHGGKIWVNSQPGAGATFFFTVPERVFALTRTRKFHEDAAVPVLKENL